MTADADMEGIGIDSNPGGHPSRLALARLLAGEYDASQKTALETHIHSCRHCSLVFENAQLDAADFARRRPTLEGLGSRRRVWRWRSIPSIYRSRLWWQEVR